eukprot:GEMP01142583.1.p1 GENE.GEMP01142583.1~~GEMP01142583.1.p1  ORF type:complete len:100 (-),score=12.27 GEMP01142583.1:56-355(-)
MDGNCAEAPLAAHDEGIHLVEIRDDLVKRTQRHGRNAKRPHMRRELPVLDVVLRARMHLCQLQAIHHEHRETWVGNDRARHYITLIYSFEIQMLITSAQ